MKNDAQLQQDVIAELADAPDLESVHIGVIVKQGVVTLTGHVCSFLEKWNAERAAQRVHGVNALVIEIAVKLPALNQRDDEDILRSAVNALQCMSSSISESVNVLIDNGWITLSGTLVWQYQKQLATEAMRHVVGLRGVSNLIDLKPQVIASNVKDNIEAALARHSSYSAKRIKVEIHGSDVQLSGFSSNWGEREAAILAAWASPGVHSVSDKELITL